MPDQSVQPQPEHHGILHKTLGEVIKSNPHAQDMIMKAMKISPEQMQEMVQKTENNQLMNMTIGDLFKNGIVSQATGQPQPLSSEQVDALMKGEQTSIPNQEIINQTPAPQQSLMQKVKSFFK
jgi:hypothetical protein